ncbi:hypothetical protein TI39_contig53g00022 [Zymoseptoria brevis]|uniref:Basic proline-rich protein n=1 Tax=Zymoseptoria brevis TaxID=1047168 RepID=A0A0F4GYR8_9PEZI|nr:hypothetical protein TI39_contig53g00022 [Zymoseptoria brevis]
MEVFFRPTDGGLLPGILGPLTGGTPTTTGGSVPQSTDGGLLPGILGPLTGGTSDGAASPTSSPGNEPANGTSPGDGGLLPGLSSVLAPIVGQPTTTPVPAASDSGSNGTGTATDDTGLLPSILNPIIGQPSTTTGTGNGPVYEGTPTAPPNSDSTGVLDPLLPDTSAPLLVGISTILNGSPTTTDGSYVPPATSTDGILQPIISDLIPGPTGSTSPAPIITGAPNTTESTTSGGSLPIPLPLPTDTPTSLLPTDIIPSSTTPQDTSIPQGTSIAPVNTLTDTPAPAANGTTTTMPTAPPAQTEPAQTETSTTESLPEYKPTDTAAPGNTSATTTEPIAPISTTPVALPSTTGTLVPTNAPPETATPVQSTTDLPVTSSKPVISIIPTGTDSATTLVVPSTMEFAPTTTQVSQSRPTGASSTSAKGMPSAMPRLVQPPGGMPVAPLNTTLIQIGFNFGLNFAFVVSTDNSASQIFTYLPEGIAYALGLTVDQIKMNALMPYDTTASLGFITTLAQAYIPSDQVSTLQLDLHTAMSKAYQNPDSAVNSLMGMINPTIPILPGANLDASFNGPSDDPDGSTDSNKKGDGAPIGGDSGSSKAVNGTSIGIGMGAVAGAAVYAAAMVYVARRYRKKRAGHKRASSLTPMGGGSGDMSERYGVRGSALTAGGMGGYFMSGANGGRSSRGSRGSSSGNGSSGSAGRTSRVSEGAGSSGQKSVREQGISAPVAQENSLGWNL